MHLESQLGTLDDARHVVVLYKDTNHNVQHLVIALKVTKITVTHTHTLTRQVVIII